LRDGEEGELALSFQKKKPEETKRVMSTTPIEKGADQNSEIKRDTKN